VPILIFSKLITVATTRDITKTKNTVFTGIRFFLNASSVIKTKAHNDAKTQIDSFSNTKTPL
jgi:hypothetical protein